LRLELAPNTPLTVDEDDAPSSRNMLTEISAAADDDTDTPRDASTPLNVPVRRHDPTTLGTRTRHNDPLHGEMNEAVSGLEDVNVTTSLKEVSDRLEPSDNTPTDVT